jgi:hypothetical protein
VLGAVMLALSSLSRIAMRGPAVNVTDGILKTTARSRADGIPDRLAIGLMTAVRAST